MAVEGHRLQLVQEVMRFRTLKNIVQAVKRSRPPPRPPRSHAPGTHGEGPQSTHHLAFCRPMADLLQGCS